MNAALLLIPFVMRCVVENCSDDPFLSFLRQLLKDSDRIFYQFGHATNYSKIGVPDAVSRLVVVRRAMARHDRPPSKRKCAEKTPPAAKQDAT